MKSGGTYLPPYKMRALQAKIKDKSGEEYQKMAWEALKKSINGLINKVNTSNIKNIVPELLSENLIRGRGLFCKSLMKAQAASLPFTPVYACLVAVVNTKFPQIGQLLLMRLIHQFKRAYKRSDKTILVAVVKFIGQLVNFRVANEILALQLLTLLLEKPTDDSVEVAVGFMREVGAFLQVESSRAANAVFERFRSILHQGQIDVRTQYMVEVLFQVRKDNYKNNPSISEELDLVEEEDQMTHTLGLTDELEVEEILNVFAFDPDFLENEAKYAEIKREILGGDSEDEDEEEEEDDEVNEEQMHEKARLVIEDQTNTNLVNLRRAIYLTIMSSLNFEECCHKLLKLDIPQGQESELTSMIVECCSQEKTFVSFYGLLGERFCRLNKIWESAFSDGFEETYKTIHRFETNRLRNIAKFYGHLLAADAIDWNIFSLISLTEQDTTSSSRIFLKILLQDLVSSLGLKKLIEKFNDETAIISVQTDAGLVNRNVFEGMFPKDHPKNTRFAINYYTSIGLGALTENLREYLAEAVRIAKAKTEAQESESSSEESSRVSESSSESGSRRRSRRRDDSSPRRRNSRSRRDDSVSPRRHSPRSSRDDGVSPIRHSPRSRRDDGVSPKRRNSRSRRDDSVSPRRRNSRSRRDDSVSPRRHSPRSHRDDGVSPKRRNSRSRIEDRDNREDRSDNEQTRNGDRSLDDHSPRRHSRDRDRSDSRRDRRRSPPPPRSNLRESSSESSKDRRSGEFNQKSQKGSSKWENEKPSRRDHTSLERKSRKNDHHDNRRDKIQDYYDKRERSPNHHRDRIGRAEDRHQRDGDVREKEEKTVHRDERSDDRLASLEDAHRARLAQLRKRDRSPDYKDVKKRK